MYSLYNINLFRQVSSHPHLKLYKASLVLMAPLPHCRPQQLAGLRWWTGSSRPINWPGRQRLILMKLLGQMNYTYYQKCSYFCSVLVHMHFVLRTRKGIQTTPNPSSSPGNEALQIGKRRTEKRDCCAKEKQVERLSSVMRRLQWNAWCCSPQ